jgi:hypothetical protein
LCCSFQTSDLFGFSGISESNRLPTGARWLYTENSVPWRTAESHLGLNSELHTVSEIYGKRWIAAATSLAPCLDCTVNGSLTLGPYLLAELEDAAALLRIATSYAAATHSTAVELARKAHDAVQNVLPKTHLSEDEHAEIQEKLADLKSELMTRSLRR